MTTQTREEKRAARQARSAARKERNAKEWEAYKPYWPLFVIVVLVFMFFQAGGIFGVMDGANQVTELVERRGVVGKEATLLTEEHPLIDRKMNDATVALRLREYKGKVFDVEVSGPALGSDRKFRLAGANLGVTCEMGSLSTKELERLTTMDRNSRAICRGEFSEFGTFGDVRLIHGTLLEETP